MLVRGNVGLRGALVGRLSRVLVGLHIYDCLVMPGVHARVAASITSLGRALRYLPLEEVINFTRWQIRKRYPLVSLNIPRGAYIALAVYDICSNETCW